MKLTAKKNYLQIFQKSTSNIRIKIFLSTIRGRTVAHGDITDVFPVLSTAFRRAIPPYTLESLKWQSTDNDPCSTSELM